MKSTTEPTEIVKSTTEKAIVEQFLNPSGRDQDKDQDQDMDQDKDQDLDPDLKSEEDSIASDVPVESIRATKVTLAKAEFDAARKAYPGSRRGLDVEWENFCKKTKPVEVAPLLLPAIERGKAYRAGCALVNAWCENWPYFSTWINQARWTQEYGAIPAPKSGAFNTPPATAAQLQATMDAVFSESKGLLQ
jgi:hypothetical protein